MEPLTYSNGIEGGVAIFRNLGFWVPSLRSVGVPGLKVREQLSWELGSHRAVLGLPCVVRRTGKECTVFRGGGGVCPGLKETRPWLLSSLSEMRGREGEQGLGVTNIFVYVNHSTTCRRFLSYQSLGKEAPTEIKLEWGLSKGWGWRSAANTLP